MYNLTSINAVQFQNLLNAIGQSGGGTDITEQLEAINTTLQNLQIQFSALAENVSLSPIEGLTATNVQEGISELNSSLTKKADITSQEDRPAGFTTGTTSYGTNLQLYVDKNGNLIANYYNGTSWKAKVLTTFS